MDSPPRQSTPAYFRYSLRLLNCFPNFDQPFIAPLRKKAVDSLQLSNGGRVLDVGCGTGGSFPYLVEAVGTSGEILGIEISSGVAAVAQKRIGSNGWENVQVVVADARTVAVTGSFDAMVMFGAPDIYASKEALANLFPLLKNGGRFVAFGAKLSHRKLGKLLNPLFRTLMKLSFDSTPQLSGRPWSLLQEQAHDLQVKEYFGGALFMVFGSMSR